jgi:predicted alpha/beta superfamily hydrolase
MKKLLSFLLFSVLYSCTTSTKTDTNIVLGNIKSIRSTILNEERKIWVYVPNGDSEGIYAKSKYPVVYLLDGDAHFYSVVGMIQQLSSINGNTLCPEMIVVGIPNTDRTRDLTPTHTDSDPMMNDSNLVKTSGGGEKFISFIEKELMPYIDSAYPTLPFRTFVGHSLGGLTVMNALVNHKNMFNAYIAIDPSMWWDNNSLLNKTTTEMAKESYSGKTLFLGMANTMDAQMDTSSVAKDTTVGTSHIRSILKLNTSLEKNKQSGLSYNYRYYDKDSHSSVPLIATYDALRFIFGFYDFRLGQDDYIHFSKNTISKVEQHYKEVSGHFGFTYPVPESMINQLGYMALANKKMPEAEYLFQLNLANYPGSFNVYDSMGDYYAAKGEKEKAVKYFKKALTIKEYPETRKKLNGLSKT